MWENRKNIVMILGIIVLAAVIVINIIVTYRNGSFNDKSKEMFNDMTETVDTVEDDTDATVSENEATVSENEAVQEPSVSENEITQEELLSNISNNGADWTTLIGIIVYDKGPADGSSAKDFVDKYSGYMTTDLYNSMFIAADYIDNAENMQYQESPADDGSEVVNIEDGNTKYVTIKNSRGEVTEFITYDEYVKRYGSEPPMEDIVGGNEAQEEESNTAKELIFKAVNYTGADDVTITVVEDGNDRIFKVVIEGNKVYGFQ